MFSKIRDNLYLASHSDLIFGNIIRSGCSAIANLATEVASPQFKDVKIHHLDSVLEAEKYTDALSSSWRLLCLFGKRKITMMHMKK
jgi:hypothetical protein